MEVLCAQLISPGEPESTCVGRSKGAHFGQGTCVKSMRGCIHGLLTIMRWATVCESHLYCVVLYKSPQDYTKVLWRLVELQVSSMHCVMCECVKL